MWQNFTNQETEFSSEIRGEKSFWEDGIITKRLGRVIYMLKGRRFEYERHLNELRPRHIKVPIFPSVPTEVSPTPPVPEVPAPWKLLKPQFLPDGYISTPKRQGIEWNFHGKISSGRSFVTEYPTFSLNHVTPGLRLTALIYCWLCPRRLAFLPNKALFIYGRLEAEKPPASAGLPSGERTASLTPFTPLYSIGPRSLV